MPREQRILCLAALGPMTAAIKAQRALLGGGIKAEVEALSPTESRRGCAYGVSFPCEKRDHARALFRSAGIPVVQYMQREQKLP